MSDLREELVDAIEDAMDKVHDMDVTFNQYASAAADAILAKLRPAPLVWHESHMKPWNGDYHTVPTAYTIRCADENGWRWIAATGAIGYCPSPEMAMNQAEAHHTAAWRKAGGLEI